MKDWLKILLYLIATIVAIMLLALTSRMHIFLAIPVIVIVVFGFSFLSAFLD